MLTLGLGYDWSNVEHAHDWLLEKISNAPADEVVKVCIVLWGVWFWRNKKVWDEKFVTSAFAMDSNFKMYSESIDAKRKQSITVSQARPVKVNSGNRWHCQR